MRPVIAGLLVAAAVIVGFVLNAEYPGLTFASAATPTFDCDETSFGTGTDVPTTMAPGDIIYSGTPSNVGPVVRGDVIDCHIDGLPGLSVKIV